MKKYRYIGDIPLLQNHTALGRWIKGNFCVQIDQFNHPWSHGWHSTTFSDWKPC